MMSCESWRSSSDSTATTSASPVVVAPRGPDAERVAHPVALVGQAALERDPAGRRRTPSAGGTRWHRSSSTSLRAVGAEGQRQRGPDERRLPAARTAGAAPAREGYAGATADRLANEPDRRRRRAPAPAAATGSEAARNVAPIPPTRTVVDPITRPESLVEPGRRRSGRPRPRPTPRAGWRSGTCPRRHSSCTSSAVGHLVRRRVVPVGEPEVHALAHRARQRLGRNPRHASSPVASMRICGSPSRLRRHRVAPVLAPVKPQSTAAPQSPRSRATSAA